MFRLLISFFLLLTSFKGQSQQWSQASLNEGKAEMNAIGYGNKIYFFSGYKRIGTKLTTVDQIEIFDIVTGSKQTIPLTGEAVRTKLATAALGGKVYFAGGFNLNFNPYKYYNQIDIYDTLTGNWSIAQLSEARNTLAAATANTNILWGGGYGNVNTNGYSPKVDILDISTNTWKDTILPRKPSALGPPFLLGERGNLTAAAVGDKVIFAGGINEVRVKDMVNIYNTKTAKWLPYTTLSSPRERLSSITFENKAYFIGGYDMNSNASDIIDIYDDATGSWSVMQIPRMIMDEATGNPRPYLQSALAGCKLFLIPGPSYGDSPTPDTIAVYDLKRNTWSYMGLPHPRTYLTVAATKDKVYFAGGGTLNTFSNRIDIYTVQPKLDIKINSLSVTGNYFIGEVLLSQSQIVDLLASNDGGYDLLLKEGLEKITVTGDIEDFTLDTSLLNDILQPAEQVSLPLTFHPTQKGERSITISIYSNDPGNPVYTLQIKGKGTITTSILAPNVSGIIEVYPNPAKERLQVLIKENFTKGYLILKDITGKTISHISLETTNEILTSNLPEGMYLLEVLTDDKRVTEKVMVTK